jgi:hypothetical protein
MAKSQLAGQRQEIRALGGDNYEFIDGDRHDPIVADGEQHPNQYGGTWSLKQDRPDKWVITYELDGKVTGVNVITVIDGGQTRLDDWKGTNADGSTDTEHAVGTRVGSGSGVVGTWELKSAEESAPSDWVIKPYGDDGLSFAWPANQGHQDIKFDGKDYPAEGPRTPPGLTSCGKRVDERTIDLTTKLKGKIVGTDEIQVSQDGKAITSTVHEPGQDKAAVFVYDKI